MRAKKDLRLFFALWPDELVREQITSNLSNLPQNVGRLVPRYNWHITLHFVGNTTLAEKNCLHKQAEKVQAAPFQLILDQSGFFKKPKVFWYGCSQVPNALFDLQERLGKNLSRCDYQPETRAYSPHVTVARKVLKNPEIKPPDGILWQVEHFVLIESVSEAGGVRYRVMEEYLLR